MPDQPPPSKPLSERLDYFIKRRLEEYERAAERLEKDKTLHQVDCPDQRKDDQS